MHMNRPTVSSPRTAGSSSARGAQTTNPLSHRLIDWLGRWAVPCTIVVAVAGAYAVGSNWLMQASERQDHLTNGDADARPLDALRPWLSGEAVFTPADEGIWPVRWRRAEGVIMRAKTDGPTQRVSLCVQGNAQPGDPGRLYPMALLAGLDSGAPGLPSRLMARNPLVLSSETGAGLPMVWLEGSAGVDGAASRTQLALRVASAPMAPAGTASAAADAPPPWVVIMATEVQQQVPADSIRHAFDKEVWLMWRPLPKVVNEGPSAGYAQAVRIRVLPDATCALGAVEWRLFTARRAPSDAPLGPAAVWVRPKAAPNLEDTIRLRLQAGRHEVPGSAGTTMEDRALFERAIEHKLIVPMPDQRLALMPADAARIPANTRTASAAELTDDARRTLKALYQSANGDFVRAQVALANRSRFWLAVRLMSTDESSLPVAARGTHWLARSGQELLELTEGLPDVSARLFRSMPTTATPWVRVQAPQRWSNVLQSTSNPRTPNLDRPGGDSVKLTLPASAVNDRQLRFSVLVLGSVVQVDGAAIEASHAACAGPGCPNEQVMTRLDLRRDAAAFDVVLHLRPQPGFNKLSPASSEHLAVQWRSGRPVWVDAPAHPGRTAPPAEVHLSAADGGVLFSSGAPSDLAREAGLLPVVGMGRGHSTALAGMLARLGQQGHAQVNARTSLDLRYQRALNDVLRCVGRDSGQWRPDAGRCELPPQATFIDDRRMAYAVVMDAVNGDIVASATGAQVPDRIDVDDLVAFDAFNPAASVLRVGAWQQVGGVTQSAGSTFKVPEALMLESLAPKVPTIERALAGQSGSQLTAMAHERGMRFELNSACYPAPCNADHAKVRNFGDAPTLRYFRNGQMGLHEALSQSSNTWFAMMGEYTDGTVRQGRADARPLGTNALRAQRPLLVVLDRLAFFEPSRLDGGLIPADYPWSASDVMQASASALDPLETVHSVRQQALGLRMQTTPLQMARIAAAVATGRVPEPRLLLALNERTSLAATGRPLEVSTVRIQRAMNAVVSVGTARGAFAQAALKDLKPRLPFIFGKTGSAPMANRDADVVCAKVPTGTSAPLACMHNAWFIGYLAPGALPGESRTLAFAVQVTHTRETGGKQAAPVISQWLQWLWTQANKPDNGAARDASPAALPANLVVPKA